MKREFLKELGLADDVINQIMAENGKDINSAKGDSEKNSAELEQLKADLKKANEFIETHKDYDQIKADAEKYKNEAANSKTEFEKKIHDMELDNTVNGFINSYKKKFANDFTKSAISKNLKDLLNDDSNKGKSLDELLEGITKDKEGVFIDENKPVPPVVPGMKTDNNGSADDVNTTRSIMGLPPLK